METSKPNDWSLVMTTNTRTDWASVAALEDEQQTAWITEHGRHLDEGGRREWMGDFVSGTLEQDEENRRRLMASLLRSLLSMEDAEAKSYATDFQWALDHGKGDAAFAVVQSLHTGARSLTVEETMRLGQIWPRVFGKDIAATI
jgi:hypothetical protein